MNHRWHFFRAGGVDQVSLRDGKDLLAIRDLDRKLWLALAMPVAGVDIEAATLSLLDLDRDGRIRVPDVISAIDFIEKTFKRPDDVLKSKSEVALDAISDPQLVSAAKRMLADLDKSSATAIHIDDTVAITKAFSATVLNGDRIIIPESAKDADLKKVIEDVIACVGSVPDRSGKPGIDQALADQFFAAVDARVAWMRKRSDAALAPLGEHTEAAAAAYLAVREKIDDYFVRCQVAAFDGRGELLGGKEADLAALAARSLAPEDPEVGKLPLARVETAARLPLRTAVNPAWATRMATFASEAVLPLVGAREHVTATDVATIAAKLAPFLAWQAEKPATKVDGLDAAWVEKLAQPGLRAAVTALIGEDAALAAEYDKIETVTKLVRLQRDGGRLFRNFINFSDFYSQQDGVFQAGTLYLDARALHLCVPVADGGKHAALAASSAAYLVYCDIKRGADSKQIAAAVTNGDADNLFVGRNGVFYDREGKDWDATITKLVANPISVREAFWSPYKKLVRTIEDSITKRAADAEAVAHARMEQTGKDIAEADKAAAAAAAAPPAPAPAKEPPKKIDLGTVAAIGVAIGGIGTLVGALLGTMFGLGKWLPLGVGALLLMISGPSMLLAWLKLRRRNLGPILDANGWAINSRARINVAFGARMTELASLPKGSQRSLDDPFADKKTPWRRWVLLLVVVIVAAMWWQGRLDKYLPQSLRSIEVLGVHAPAANQPTSAVPVVPVPAAPAAPAPTK